MKYTREQYLDAMDGYFGPDDLTSRNTFSLVKTRTEHECMGIHHSDTRTIPAGSMAMKETAVHVDGGWVSCYVCLTCADEWVAEILF